MNKILFLFFASLHLAAQTSIIASMDDSNNNKNIQPKEQFYLALFNAECLNKKNKFLALHSQKELEKREKKILSEASFGNNSHKFQSFLVNAMLNKDLHEALDFYQANDQDDQAQNEINNSCMLTKKSSFATSSGSTSREAMTPQRSSSQTPMFDSSQFDNPEMDSMLNDIEHTPVKKRGWSTLESPTTSSSSKKPPLHG